MNISQEPTALLRRQLNSMYGIDEEEASLIDILSPLVLADMEICFSNISNKYYNMGGGNFF